MVDRHDAPRSGRVLGVDLGSRRIGVAVSDSAGRMALPYEVVVRSGDQARDHRRLADLVVEADAEAVVVGLPFSLDGDLGPAAHGVLEEVAKLRTTLGVPVHLYDERLTTVTAQRQLRQAGLDARARRQVVDKVAASIILQAWLENRQTLENRRALENGYGTEEVTDT